MNGSNTIETDKTDPNPFVFSIQFPDRRTFEVVEVLVLATQLDLPWSGSRMRDCLDEENLRISDAWLDDLSRLVADLCRFAEQLDELYHARDEDDRMPTEEFLEHQGTIALAIATIYRRAFEIFQSSFDSSKSGEDQLSAVNAFSMLFRDVGND